MPLALSFTSCFPNITEYVRMSPLSKLMERVPEYSCFENFWVLIYNTVNIKNITHILKALIIFKSLKKSWDEQICETLLYCHGRHAQFHLTLCNPMDCSLSGSLSMGFSGQEYWSGLPFPPPGHLPWPKDRTQVSCIGRQIVYCIIKSNLQTCSYCFLFVCWLVFSEPWPILFLLSQGI